MELKNSHGTVSVYIRHIPECKQPKKGCRCPRWAYIRNVATGERDRRSLHCNSDTEASEQATKLFKALDPEEAKKSAEAAAKQRNTKTVEEAIALFLARTEREFGRKGGYAQYRSLLGWRNEKGEAHGTLLNYVELHPVETIADITPIWLQKFYSSWDFSNSTMQQRWALIKTFFSFLTDMEVLAKNPAEKIKPVSGDGLYKNLPLSPEQYTNIAEATDDDRRLFCFLELMRRTGMDLEDAIMFRVDSIDADGVLRYHRQKTGVEAIIPLEPETLALLRTIPLDKDSLPEMPFRRNTDMVNDHKLWYLKLKALFTKAGVTEVKYQQVTKAVSPKCLRHTFAVGALAAGQDIPSVSKMLGHKTTAQTERVYLPWCPQRDEAHIRKVREAQRVASAKQQVAEKERVMVQ